MMHFAHMYGMSEGHYQMWGNAGLGMFLWVLLWSFLVAALVYGVIRLNQDANSKENVSAIEIAQMRYAKGEITKKEYEEYKKDLKE